MIQRNFRPHNTVLPIDIYIWYFPFTPKNVTPISNIINYTMVFAESVNIARRLSTKNENDLVQENMMGKFDLLVSVFDGHLNGGV